VRGGYRKRYGHGKRGIRIVITFKQFLQEEEDITHSNTKQAAEAFVQHCKEWKDIDHPLYRLTDSEGRFAMRSRSPRRRNSDSKGGSRDVQRMIFAQKGWENYPDRLHSIFCSTNKEFAVGDVDEFSENLIVIYPFDGTKLAITTDTNDFNLINLIRINSINEFPVMDFASAVNQFWTSTIGRYKTGLDWRSSLMNLKEVWLKDGKFDPTANGNEEYAERYESNSNTFRKALQFIVENVPEIWTPEYLGCELVTPATIELPGKTREVWFSGKYLSIPWHKWKAFKEDVKSLQADEEPKDRSLPKTVTRAPSRE